MPKKRASAGTPDAPGALDRVTQVEILALLPDGGGICAKDLQEARVLIWDWDTPE